MKHVIITDFLTPEEIERAHTLWLELRDTGRFAETLDREIIAPNMERINQALGQENHARYLAYAVEHIFTEMAKTIPGHLWEWAEDRCQVCGLVLGHGLRFMHVGLCEQCKAAPKH